MKTCILPKYQLTCNKRDIRIIIASLKLYMSRLSPEDDEEIRNCTSNIIFDLEEIIGA